MYERFNEFNSQKEKSTLCFFEVKRNSLTYVNFWLHLWNNYINNTYAYHYINWLHYAFGLISIYLFRLSRSYFFAYIARSLANYKVILSFVTLLMLHFDYTCTLVINRTLIFYFYMYHFFFLTWLPSPLLLPRLLLPTSFAFKHITIIMLDVNMETTTSTSISQHKTSPFFDHDYHVKRVPCVCVCSIQHMHHHISCCITIGLVTRERREADHHSWHEPCS